LQAACRPTVVSAAAASETEHPVESAEAPTELAAEISRGEVPVTETLSEVGLGGRDLTAQAHAQAAIVARPAGHLEAAVSVAAVVAGPEAAVADADKLQERLRT
jgi:hypothetical protein